MFPQRKIAPSSSVFTLAGVLRLIALGIIFISAGHAAKASGTLIPAPARVDVVYDSARDTVYITSGTSVLRYQTGTNSFLSPIELGGSLSGIDLSPDGNTLAVADKTRSATEVWIHLVDLTTGVSRKVTFPRASYEGGTYTVAFASDGAVVVTSTYEGSGWVPMRKYDPATGATSVLASSVRLNTMLAASGDRSVIGFAESDASDGPFGRYRVTDGNLLRKSGYTDGTSKYNYEMGANRNGTQYAIPTYGGTYIYTDDLHKITTIGQAAGPQPIGVVYHPAEDLVYFAWTGSTEVRAFDTNTFTQVAAYDFEYGFTNTGNWAFTQGRLKMSRDGSLLFATVNGGVRYVRLYAPLAADNQSIVTDEDSTSFITLTGSVGNGGALSYSVASNPAHGKLEGVAPYLFYTPDRDYNGTDSFTFKTTYGAASVEATVSLTVNPVNDAPVADDQSLTTTEDFGKYFVMTGSDVEGDSLNYQIVSPPSHGQIVAVSIYGPAYMPDPDFHGEDSFTYKANDGSLDSNPATVSVTVTPVNDAPTTNNQTATTNEDTAQTITLSGSDVDGDPLSYVLVNGPTHGAVTGSGLNVTYTPEADYSGNDNFAFRLSDGSLDSRVCVVTIQVAPVNDAPVAVGDTATTNRGVPVSIPVRANDTDVDGDVLTVVSVSKGSAGGVVTINSGGTGVTLTPRNSYFGQETFSYVISDGKGGTSSATVLVNVLKR